MFHIKLKNGKSFHCDENSTVFEAAKQNGLFLEHSCLAARCRSCVALIESGTTIDKLDDLVLSKEEKLKNWTLTCNAIPRSDLALDVEDLSGIQVSDKKIIPAKINTIKKVNSTIVEVSLRLPPNSNFRYNPGQYVNISKGELKRSYSIANAGHMEDSLTFFIKKYSNGLMSRYWFDQAKVNDLLRIEGPIGSFFYKETEAQNIIFLATGTGIAPIKAILEGLDLKHPNLRNKKFLVFNGAKYESDLFWKPFELNDSPNLEYIPVLSRETENWKGEKGYIQEAVIKSGIDLNKSQVYACGSKIMIESAKKLLAENGLNIKNFYSDIFVASNTMEL